MPTTHVVQQGECFSRIAKQYGFRDYKLIYDQPENATLRQQRPNPHILHPGDTIHIPDKRTRSESRVTGLVHRFVTPSARRILRIVVEDCDGRALAGCPYKMVVGPETFEGTLPGNGMLEAQIPAEEETAELEVTASDRVYQWPVRIAWLNPPSKAPDEGISGIQARLRNIGFDPGPIDGILGRKTEQALRAFQAKHPPLVVDGICGPQTLAKLIERHGC